ncbi:sensor histidine kinase, partial [Kineococcus glutinatus]|uniref:sensor histidine kinase n=1 Tax=Kineococcus glutinatus TaxID=1070872 RepID=UPI0031ED2662
HNPWVDGRLARVRFYASAPLITPEGHALGSLCVFDSAPKELTPEQFGALQDLAAVVVGLFERRRQVRQNAELVAEAQEQRLLSQLTMHEMESRQEFTETVLDTVDVGVVACDARGRLTMFNRTARELHGLDADASVAPSQHAEVYGIFEPDGVTLLKAERVPLHRALHEGSVQDAEVVLAPAGQPRRTVVASGRALHDEGGALLGAVAVLRDVTAERAQRAALEATSAQLARHGAELERSNRDLEQFAAIASHDLAAPLTVVGGYVEMVRDIHGADLDEQADEWLGTALQGVTRMKDLIAALLSYARAGSTCQRELTATRDLVDQAVVDLRTAVKEAGARVTAPGDLPVLHCDPTLVRQLLQNLLGNAIKYRSPERPCRVVVTAGPVPEGWEFAVQDNGRGIPVEQREHVFGMFAMGEPGARTGHGIGLATCQRIVERHGGRIWVDADRPAEEGTTIRFTLPQRQHPRG